MKHCLMVLYMHLQKMLKIRKAHRNILPQHLSNARPWAQPVRSVTLASTVNLSLRDLQLGENSDKSRSFIVAIKKLKVDASWELKKAFQEEIKCMMKLKHANVLRLLGVCSLGSPPFSVVEYMENGDLHEFLLKQKLVPDNTRNLEDGEATPLILLYMAVQIASGMRFLASRNFIHRDLATRNCMVGREFVVKISEFGMSRSLYDAYYFRIQGQLILPIRWMAYESFYGKFSTKSDVWSFGVALWRSTPWLSASRTMR